MLFEEPFAVALNPDASAGGTRKSLQPADLDGQTLLLLEDGHCLRDQALEVCARVRVHESSDYRATSLETLRQMVAAGHGITLLPEMAAAWAVRRCAQPGGASVRQARAQRQIGAVWRRSSTRMPAIQAVCDVIASGLRDR